MFLATGPRDPGAGYANQQFVNVLMPGLVDRVGSEAFDIACKQESFLRTPLAGDDQFRYRAIVLLRRDLQCR